MYDSNQPQRSKKTRKARSLVQLLDEMIRDVVGAGGAIAFFLTILTILGVATGGLIYIIPLSVLGLALMNKIAEKFGPRFGRWLEGKLVNYPKTLKALRILYKAFNTALTFVLQVVGAMGATAFILSLFGISAAVSLFALPFIIPVAVVGVVALASFCYKAYRYWRFNEPMSQHSFGLGFILTVAGVSGAMTWGLTLALGVLTPWGLAVVLTLTAIALTYYTWKLFRSQRYSESNMFFRLVKWCKGLFSNNDENHLEQVLDIKHASTNDPLDNDTEIELLEIEGQDHIEQQQKCKQILQLEDPQREVDLNDARILRAQIKINSTKLKEKSEEIKKILENDPNAEKFDVVIFLKWLQFVDQMTHDYSEKSCRYQKHMIINKFYEDLIKIFDERLKLQAVEGQSTSSIYQEIGDKVDQAIEDNRAFEAELHNYDKDDPDALTFWRKYVVRSKLEDTLVDIKDVFDESVNGEADGATAH